MQLRFLLHPAWANFTSSKNLFALKMEGANREIKSLCVFCGSSRGTSPEYLEAATSLGRILGQNKVRLVYGGGDLGLMGAVARGVLSEGGKVLGVIPRSLYNVVNEAPGDTKLVDTMHERKQIIYDESDAFLALPGGFGTFEELMEVTTWQQLGILHKPVAVLNIDGFYDHLIALIQNATQKGFIRNAEGERIHVFTKPEEVLDGMKRAKVPASNVKWQHHKTEVL